jgi:DNA-binding GntR family transcriptional regulator
MSRVDEALNLMRAAIEQRELLPGEPLRLDALSQQLNMSVQPIREAIRLLEAEGIVERSMNRGVVVAKVSLAEVIELSCLRTVLEPMMTGLATVRATTSDLADLRAEHEEIAAEIAQGMLWDSVIPKTIEWHRHIYRISRSPQLSDFVSRVWVAIRINSAWRNSHAVDTIAEHEAILSAMEARDSGRASAAMRRHVREGVVGHLEGFVGEGDPAVAHAVATYDLVLQQMEASSVDNV